MIFEVLSIVVLTLGLVVVWTLSPKRPPLGTVSYEYRKGRVCPTCNLDTVWCEIVETESKFSLPLGQQSVGVENRLFCSICDEKVEFYPLPKSAGPITVDDILAQTGRYRVVPEMDDPLVMFAAGEVLTAQQLNGLADRIARLEKILNWGRR